jgi:hypothetical protein
VRDGDKRGAGAASGTGVGTGTGGAAAGTAATEPTRPLEDWEEARKKEVEVVRKQYLGHKAETKKVLLRV